MDTRFTVMESPLKVCKRPADNNCSPFSSPKKAKIEDVKRNQEENNFYRLKNIIIDTIIGLKNVSEDDIRDALWKIINSFKSFSFREINLSQWDYACAYFHRFGAQGSGLTRFKVLDALQNCEDLALKFKESNLNITSLGGGPGNDIVGLTSALYESEIRSCLNITIMDSVKEWSSFVNILNVFIKEGNYGNATQYFRHNKVNLSFLQAKLPDDSTENAKCYQVLREADVILMIRFISSFNIKERLNMVQDVYESMKTGAFALVIDAPIFEDHWREFETLYLSEAEEDYYYNVSNSTMRFEHFDCNSTKARVMVLRKN